MLFNQADTAMASGSVFTCALEGMKLVKSENGEMLTKPFLDVCKHLLPVLAPQLALVYMMPDKFGAAFSPVKSDVGNNISRLEAKYSSNPSEFNLLYSIVRSEIEAKTVKSSTSCTNALLWLTRAMDYLVELFRNLQDNPDWPMSKACTEAYNKTLKKWHNWIASSGFSVGIKFAPERKKFMEILGETADLTSDIQKFCTNFSPLLEANHKFLDSVGMDNLKA